LNPQVVLIEATAYRFIRASVHRTCQTHKQNKLCWTNSCHT